MRSFSTRRADHSETSSALLLTSVYWYCERLWRVLTWMSCTGWKNTTMPGTADTARLQAVDDGGYSATCAPRAV